MGTHSASRGAAALRAQRALRICLLIVILVAVGLAVAEQQSVRAVEASLVASWMPSVLGQPVVAVGAGFLTRRGAAGPVLFEITPECTVLLLVAPIAVFISALLLHRKTSLVRILLTLLTTSVTLVVVNQLRLYVIAWATTEWGIDPGYTVSHVFVGSALGIIGFVGCVVLAVFMLGLRRTSTRSARATRAGGIGQKGRS